jgi:Tol biopolymer transport system component
LITRRMFTLIVLIVILVAAVFLLREPINCWLYLREPHQGQIAFLRAGDLYVMEAQGHNQCPLVWDDIVTINWSPDGQQLLFVTEYDYQDYRLHVVNANGTDRRDLPSQLALDLDTPPQWSPDGQQIVYLDSLRDVPYSELDYTQISAVDAADGEVHVLAQLEEFNVGVPSWSPDGQRLASMSETRLYVMKKDGTNLQEYTRDEMGVVFPAPAWSPDSRQIAFLAGEDHATVRLITLDDEADAVVKDFTYSAFGYITGLMWLPNSDQIALAVRVLRRGDDDRDVAQVVMLDLASGSFRDLVTFEQTDASIVSLAAAPDSSNLIVTLRNYDTPPMVLTVDVQTGAYRPLAEGGNGVPQPI